MLLHLPSYLSWAPIYSIKPYLPLSHFSQFSLSIFLKHRKEEEEEQKWWVPVVDNKVISSSNGSGEEEEEALLVFQPPISCVKRIGQSALANYGLPYFNIRRHSFLWTLESGSLSSCNDPKMKSRSSSINVTDHLWWC